MADLRLKSIEIRNWMSVRESRVEFPEKGLVLVVGSNLASEGKLQSIGAGKTALGEALARTLLGVNGRFTHLGYFLNEKCKKDMYVKVNAELVGKHFCVELGYRCPELVGDGEALRFQIGDEPPFQAGSADITRERLLRTLKVTPELANWTAFIDGDRLKFNKLSQVDSVNLLMTALAQPPWTEYADLAAKKYRSASQQVAVSQRSLDSARDNLKRAQEDLQEAIRAKKEAEEKYEQDMAEHDKRIEEIKSKISADRSAITAAEKRMAQIKKELKAIEESKAEQNHKWEIERQGYRDQLAEAEPAWREAAKNHAKWEKQLEDAERALKDMEKVPKTCPRCGKPWDAAHSEQELEKARRAVEAAEAGFQKAQRALMAHESTRSMLTGKIAAVERKMRETGKTVEAVELGEEYSSNERLVRNLGATVHQRELQLEKMAAGVDVTFVNKKSVIAEERERAAELARKAVETAASDLALDEETLKIVQYWHKAFGPTGIPNMILTDAVPMLNRVAQRISNLMTGGTLQITYSTMRELVSGDSKAQLVTKVVNRIGSKRPEGSSKGEGGLTNLIIAENLNEIGQVSNRVGFRWYDEVTSGQDAVVRRSIFAYLKEVANRMGILIFVVDHHVEAASYADYVLVAEKGDKGTTYYWR
jgi:DNA repair exonuclease SbcCD ATPase subunit